MTQPIDDDRFEDDDRGYCISQFGDDAIERIKDEYEACYDKELANEVRAELEWYVGKFVEWCRHHNGERQRLEQENARYRRWFGCDSCGEVHAADAMCPPHEMRTTGMTWFKSAIRSAEADNQRLEQQVAALEAENERLKEAVQIAANLCRSTGFSSRPQDYIEATTRAEGILRAALSQGANQPAEQR